jgi:hypothetical protein
MAPESDSGQAALTYSGEVWTDARGLATVALPRPASRWQGNLDYELCACSRVVTAKVVAQLVDGRFTIATDEPHVKVDWRVTAQTARQEEGR